MIGSALNVVEIEEEVGVTIALSVKIDITFGVVNDDITTGVLTAVVLGVEVDRTAVVDSLAPGDGVGVIGLEWLVMLMVA